MEHFDATLWAAAWEPRSNPNVAVQSEILDLDETYPILYIQDKCFLYLHFLYVNILCNFLLYF
jgi:hypothetical protein